MALERKKCIFYGNDDAVIYSLIGCFNTSEVNFREWLVYVLESINEYDNDYSKDLAELLSQNWKRANSQKI